MRACSFYFGQQLPISFIPFGVLCLAGLFVSGPTQADSFDLAPPAPVTDRQLILFEPPTPEEARELMECQAEYLRTETARYINSGGNAAEAIEVADRRLYLVRKLHESPSMEIADAEANSAFVCVIANKTELAKEHIKLALGECSRSQRKVDNRTAKLYRNLAVTYLFLGDYASSENYFKQAVAIRNDLQGPLDKESVSTSCLMLSVKVFNCSEIQETIPLLEEMLQKQKSVLGVGHPDTIRTLRNLSSVLYHADQRKRAKDLAVEVLLASRQHLGERHLDTATAYYNLGCCLADSEEELAEDYLKQALAIQTDLSGRNDSDVANTLCWLGDVSKELGKHKASERYLEEALRIRQTKLGPWHEGTVEVWEYLVDLYFASEEPRSAKKCLEQVLNIERETKGPKHFDCVWALTCLGSACGELGEFDIAEQYLREGLAICEETHGSNHQETANVWRALALHYSEQENFVAAETCYWTELEIYRQLGGRTDFECGGPVNSLLRIYWSQGRRDEALACYAELSDIVGAVTETADNKEYLDLMRQLLKALKDEMAASNERDLF